MSKLKVQHVDTRHPRGTLFIGHDGSTTHFHPHSRVILHDYATQDWVKQYISEGIDADLDDLITKREAYDTFPAIHISRVEPVDESIHLNDFWICSDPDAKATYVCTGIERDDAGIIIKYNWRKFVPSPDLDDDVQKLKEDVVTLEGEIESLISLNEKGSWASTPNDPPESGKVNFSSTDFTTSPMTVKISKLDTDGTSHTFNTADIGTWIEFVEDDQDYCLGQITAVDNDDDDFFLATFDVSVAKGDVHEGSNVKIRLFEAVNDFDPASLRIVDINATPPVDPNDGDLWYDNNEDTMQLQVYHHDSEAWIAAAPPSTLSGRVAVGEATQAEIQSDLSDLKNQVYNALIEQNRIKHQPPGVKFAYQDGSSGLTEKHFQLWEDGSNKRMRISTKGVDIDWLDQGISPDYTMNDGPYFSIYYMPTIASATDRVKWRQRWHGRVSRIDWHTDDILVYISSWHAYGSLSADANYFITIGGIL